MEFASQLKSSLDIVRVIGEYVRLQPAGAGRFKGLCPFHQEKTPSFNVNQTKQFYKCFGCGEGGDVFNFVMKHDGMTFWESVQFLAERNGIPLPKRSEHSDAESRQRGAITEMHAIALDVYRSALHGPVGQEARSYLQRRGLTQELIDTFELGFAEPSGQALARRFGGMNFSTEQIEASGLLRKRAEGGYYDYFRGRLMFPIHSEQGKAIAFGGRAMRDEDQPKYLNSPETPVYRKTSVLYNLHRARETMRRKGRAVLVEGYMDVIGVWAAGVQETVASCGTALTNAQVRSIHRHADAVVVNFDPDNAGANAAERAIPLFLDEGVNVRVLALEGEGETKLDPDEYVKSFGVEAYRARLESASTYFHWLADRARVKFDMRSAEGRTKAFKTMLLPAVLLVRDDIERAAVASDLAQYLGVDTGIVLDEFKKAARDRRPASAPREEARGLPAVEKMLLHALLSSDRVRAEFLPALGERLIDGFATREIFEQMRHIEAEGAAALFGELEARLGEESRELLHQALTADDTDEEQARSQAEACLRKLESEDRKRRLAELRMRVKSAEREGRVEEALQWISEMSKLQRALEQRD